MSQQNFIFKKATVTHEYKPKSRTGHRMITDGNDTVYMFGGCKYIGYDNKQYYSDLWSFKLTNNDMSNIKWEYINTQNRIKARHWHGMIYDSNKIYIIGGGSVDGDLNDIHYLDLNKREYIWKNLNVPNFPSLCGFTSHLYNNKIIIYGGYVNSKKSNAIYSLDILNATINEIRINYNNIILPETFLHSSCLDNNKLFINGGLGRKNSDILYIDLSLESPSLHRIKTDMERLYLHKMFSVTTEINRHSTETITMIVDKYAEYKIPESITRIVYSYLKDDSIIYTIGGYKTSNEILYSYANNSNDINGRRTNKNIILPHKLYDFDGCYLNNSIILFGGKKNDEIFNDDILYLNLDMIQ